MMAGLSEYFEVIWTLGADQGCPGGVFQDYAGVWRTFPLPMMRDLDIQAMGYKAQVLHDVAYRPTAWFPQLTGHRRGERSYEHLNDLMIKSMVLVDGRASFQGQCPKDDDMRVLRYCEVAHYDDEYRDQGFLMHMGGIGAKNLTDYVTLQSFVDSPWEYRVADFGLEFEEMSQMKLQRLGFGGA